MKTVLMQKIGATLGMLHPVRKNILAYMVGVILILAVKRFYSTAGPNDLVWILKPIAWMIHLVTGIDFQYESTAGFVSPADRVVIAPACAGINFLIICFATLFFTLIARMNTAATKLLWLLISTVSAYMVTICANSVRIIISIYLYGAHIYGDLVTPERIHRLAGTLIYVPALVMTYLVAERIVGRLSCKECTATGTVMPKIFGIQRVMCAPLAWYLAIAVVVPLLNGSIQRHGTQYWEHAVFVLAATFSIFLAWLVLDMVKKNIDLSRETKEKRARQGIH